MLRPGESVPGDITRDGGAFGSADVGDASTSSVALSSSALGIGRDAPMPGGLFANIIAQRGSTRHSVGAQSGRSSLRGDFSMGDVSGLGGRWEKSAREAELERTLDLGPESVLEELDEMARRNLFGSSGRVSSASGALDTSADEDDDIDDESLGRRG
jgi:hypothetical protein